MSDNLPELTPEQLAAFHRAVATVKDEDFSPEDMTAIRRGWLGLVKEKSYSHPGWHYEQPALKGQPPRGSVRLSRNFFAALGQGSLERGGAIVAHMLSVAPGDDVTVVPPDTIRDLGHGDLKAGHKVLRRWIAQTLRRQPHDDYLQPDGTRPARVIR